MSTMMYPGAAPPGLDVGGGGTPAPPPDAATLQALLGGLQGGPPNGPDLGPDLAAGLGPGGPADAGPGGSPDAEVGAMSPTEHIQAAMRHLMMAMTQSQDEQQGHGITKGMATLQGLLAGDAKARLARPGG
jgi:hypothetical protein